MSENRISEVRVCFYLEPVSYSSVYKLRVHCCFRAFPYTQIFIWILQEHANPQSRHALGAPLGTPTMSSHHAAGAAFPQLPFPSVHHHSLFPMMPPGLGLSGGPFSHQNKNAHGINDMGPPMFSVRKEFMHNFYKLYLRTLLIFCST